MTIQIKAIEQYFHVVLFIMLYKVVLTFKSVDESVVCDNSDELLSNSTFMSLIDVHVVKFIMLNNLFGPRSLLS